MADNFNKKVLRAAKTYASAKQANPANNYDVERRYMFGSQPTVGRGSIGSELGQIAHRKIFETGVPMAAPSVGNSSYFQTAKDYTPMDLSGLYERLGVMPKRGVVEAPQFGERPAQSEVRGPGGQLASDVPFLFTRPRPGMGPVGQLPASRPAIGPGRPAIEATGSESPAGPRPMSPAATATPALGTGAPNMFDSDTPIVWNGQSKVRGRKRPGPGQLQWI